MVILPLVLFLYCLNSTRNKTQLVQNKEHTTDVGNSYTGVPIHKTIVSSVHVTANCAHESVEHTLNIAAQLHGESTHMGEFSKQYCWTGWRLN